MRLVFGPPAGASLFPPGQIPPGPPSADEIAAGEIRIVQDKDQNPCENKHGDEVRKLRNMTSPLFPLGNGRLLTACCVKECQRFEKAGECDENKRWMSANCELACRRCLDHMPFWCVPYCTRTEERLVPSLHRGTSCGGRLFR